MADKHLKAAQFLADFLRWRNSPPADRAAVALDIVRQGIVLPEALNQVGQTGSDHYRDLAGFGQDLLAAYEVLDGGDKAA